MPTLSGQSKVKGAGHGTAMSYKHYLIIKVILLLSEGKSANLKKDKKTKKK